MPFTTLPERPQKYFALISQIGSRMLAEVHETVWRCGAAQLLRAHVSVALGGSMRIDCSLLHAVLTTVDAALLTELREEDVPAATRTRQEMAGDGRGEANQFGNANEGLPLDESLLPPTALNEATADLSPYLDAAGLGQAKEHVMVLAPALPRLPLVLAIFTANQLSKMGWSASLAALTELKGKLADESIDGVPLVSGVACILRQFHAGSTDAYIAYLSQLMRCHVHVAFSAAGARPAEPPADACALLRYLELFSRHAGVDVPRIQLYQTAQG